MTITLAIDIGGTKIGAGLVNSNYQILKHTTFPSHRGIDALITTFQSAIQWASHSGFSAVAIATPGKLIGPSRGIIAPKTARNMESFPGEFDGLDLKKRLRPHMDGTREPFLINDALAQLAGGILDFGLSMPSVVGYIGPGTGLGGGCAQIQSDSRLKFLTDGHFFDIMLPRDPKDIWSPAGSTVMSEDVISGRGFYDITGISVLECTQSSHLMTQHAPLIACFGRYLGQLIATIQSGSFAKKYPDTQWSTYDLATVAEITTWIIGGSLGTLLVPYAEKWLAAYAIRSQLLPIGDVHAAALRGVVYARDMA